MTSASQQSTANDSNEYSISISRLGLNEKKLAERYSFQKYKPDNALKSTKNYIKKTYRPSLLCVKNLTYKRVPFLKWVKSYSLKENLLKDFIGGLTIGIVTIPQGMGYSMMAGLPPINGLYVSFFTGLIYLLFGTSKHLSIGTYGIVSLMVKSVLERYEGKLYPLDGDDAATQNGTHHQQLTTMSTVYATRSSSSSSSLPHYQHYQPSQQYQQYQHYQYQHNPPPPPPKMPNVMYQPQPHSLRMLLQYNEQLWPSLASASAMSAIPRSAAEAVHNSNTNNNNNDFISNDPEEAKVLISMAITLLAGIFQVSVYSL